MRSALLACLWLTVSCIVQADDAAQEIADKMLARYESLRSYRDSSTLELRLAGVLMKGTATTRYVAPDSVLVTGEAGEGRRVFAAEKGEWRIWSPEKGWETPRTPGLWFSSLTGTSMWLSDGPTVVLSILFPEDTYTTPLRELLRKAHKRPDERLERVDCHVLEVKGTKRTQVLWIGKPDLLIRRIDETNELFTRITHIRPEADPPITAGELRREADRLGSL
jgi:hypothetical protein